jgi:hypothetical protein
VFYKFAPVCCRQAFIDLERKPFVIIRSKYACGCTVEQKSTLRPEPKAFRLRSSGKCLSLESIKDAEENAIQEPPMPISANFRQKALDVAIAEINKTDLKGQARVDRTVKAPANRRVKLHY